MSHLRADRKVRVVQDGLVLTGTAPRRVINARTGARGILVGYWSNPTTGSTVSACIVEEVSATWRLQDCKNEGEV